jgi:UDP-N-acetylmuramoylalanine--D-glutamate ligase
LDHISHPGIDWLSNLETALKEKKKVNTGAELKDKNVVVLGLGLSGQSCVRFLLAHQARVTAMDSRRDLQLNLPLSPVLGEFDPAILAAAEMILLSPGIALSTPAVQAAMAAGVEVIGDIELFARYNRSKLLVITGSNGKSTVTTLLTEMLKLAGKKVAMGGNIGIPALDLLEQDAEFTVLELSSFQLETTSSMRPLAATVLNVSDDHLDRYADFGAYRQAKLRIYQDAQYLICNRDDPLTWPEGHKADYLFGLSGSANGFSWESHSATVLLDGEVFVKAADCLLVGAHNMQNIQAAAALALCAGIDKDSIVAAARSFGGLPHRCQTVSLYKGIRWINDSKATNVGATVAAIQGLSQTQSGRLLLIAGGEGKGADFTPLTPWLASAVDVLLTLGKDGDKIACLKADAIKVSTLQEAVQLAAQLSDSGDTVLLSPACASLDMFNNYQHRGQCFVDAIEELAA